MTAYQLLAVGVLCMRIKDLPHCPALEDILNLNDLAILDRM